MYLLIYLFIPIIMEFATKLALALSEVSFLDLLDDNDWKFWDQCDIYTFKNHTFEYSI